MRIDAHHHLWDLGRRRYAWLDAPALAPIRRSYDVAELAEHAARAGVGATVLVQTVPDLDETRDFLAVAESSDLVAGVVGWVDLTGDVAAQVARLRAGPGGDRLVGIRHQAQDEPDPGWLTRPDVLRGIAEVGAAGLVYDLLVLPAQLPAAAAAARALPDVRFVLDHAGKPPIAAGEWSPWREHLGEVAASPSVACKLSGLVTEAAWDRWSVTDLYRYAQAVLDAFGTGRVMFGSDWPVCELAGGYGDVVATVDAFVADRAEEERREVWGATAARVYGLDDVG